MGLLFFGSKTSVASSPAGDEEKNITPKHAETVEQTNWNAGMME
jgi:hypothetical protein